MPAAQAVAVPSRSVVVTAAADGRGVVRVVVVVRCVAVRCVAVRCVLV